MTVWWLLLVTSVVTLKRACGDTDATKQPGTSGTDVVNAVVDTIRSKCVLSEDRLFLRRLAYVETRDGADPETYKNGYHGGIWNVSQAMFSSTNTCPAVIRQTCDVIRREFYIDWTKVTWSDLRKPLYSGLAAVLYLMVRMGSNTPNIAATIQGQASQWTHFYHFGHPAENYTALATEATDYECKDPTDIAFILDGSGSISSVDFALSRSFVADVVSAMDIPTVARVAVIVFDDTPTVQFTFDRYLTKSALLTAIHGITQTSGGTAINLALDKARTSLFTAAGGTRPRAKRVAVLVTDGNSNALSATQAANRLRDESGVTVFSIGVGGYDLDELHAIASTPPCMYTYTLPDFSVIHSILYEIQRATCNAPMLLTNNNATGNGTGTGTITTETPTPITTTGGPGFVEIKTRCGVAYVYVSYTTPNPNSALYNQMMISTEGSPAYVITRNTSTGQPLYMTVVGNAFDNCTDFSINVTRKNETAHIMCMVDDNCQECTDKQILENSRIRELIPCLHDHKYDFQNPCSREAMAAGHVLFPYPYDPHQFIHCDYQGNPYVTLCPHRLPFNKDTLTCGYSGGSGSKEPLPPTHENPCTATHIQAQYLYFAYDLDKRKFIHCDLFGNAWLEQCPALEIWNQEELTCVADTPNVGATTTKAPSAFKNPCTPEALAAGQMYHLYPCDHTRFIHCDITGNYWVQFCPGGMYYDPSSFVCLVTDPQSNHGCD